MQNSLDFLRKAVHETSAQRELRRKESHTRARASYEQKVVRRYEATARRQFNPTEKTRYMNMGYWKGEPQTLDEACEAMARFVGETAQLCKEDCVLDVGFGFGDQDIFWIEQFGPKSIVGLNISPFQVENAKKRVAEHGMTDRIDLRLGSAVAMPFSHSTFDKVVALESAHHFLTRVDFFREAYRVLRRNGLLVTADVIPLPNRTIRHFAVNKLNMYSRDVYLKKLIEAGFTDVRLTSVREHVLLPFVNYVERRKGTTNILQKLGKIIHRMISSRLDYVIASAVAAKQENLHRPIPRQSASLPDKKPTR